MYCLGPSLGKRSTSILNSGGLGVQTIHQSTYFSPGTNHRTTIHRTEYLPAGLFIGGNFARGLFTGN